MTAGAQSRENKKGITLEDYFEFEYKSERWRILEREGERWIDTEFYEEGDVLKIGDCEVPLEEVYWKVGFGTSA